MSYDEGRLSNGRFAESTFAAVYAEIKRLDQLRGADQVALSAALLAAKTAVDAALAAAEKAVAAALIAAKEAVNKAELAQQRTNEGQNEFRGQLKDQAATFLTRNEYGISHANMLDKLEGAYREIGSLRSRLDVGPPALATLQAESQNRSGRNSGTGDTWKYVAVIATIGLGALSALIAILGVLK